MPKSSGDLVEFERWGGDGKLQGKVRIVELAGFTKVSALGVEERRVWVSALFRETSGHDSGDL